MRTKLNYNNNNKEIILLKPISLEEIVQSLALDLNNNKYKYNYN